MCRRLTNGMSSVLGVVGRNALTERVVMASVAASRRGTEVRRCHKSTERKIVVRRPLEGQVMVVASMTEI